MLGGERREMAGRSLSQPAQDGPILPSGWYNKFASQIRQVQGIRFRVLWRVTEFVGKSLISNDAQSNQFRFPAQCRYDPHCAHASCGPTDAAELPPGCLN